MIKAILENPIKAGLEESMSDWEFSNAKNLLTTRNGTISDINYVVSLFPLLVSMAEFLTDKTEKTSYEFWVKSNQNLNKNLSGFGNLGSLDKK